jgi:hypothetical protein
VYITEANRVSWRVIVLFLGVGSFRELQVCCAVYVITRSKGHSVRAPNQMDMYHTTFDLKIDYKLVLFVTYVLVGHPWPYSTD